VESTHGEADERWAEGLILDDPALAEEVLRRWQSVCPPNTQFRRVPRDLGTATVMINDAATSAVRALTRREPRATPQLLADIGATHAALEAYAGRMRLRTLDRVQTALDRLRDAATLAELMRLAGTELCACGFDRTMISQVDGRHVVPRIVQIPADPGWAHELEIFAAGQRLALDDLVAEARMVRSIAPILVAHSEGLPKLLRATEARSYVAAPITFQGVVIGFLHADCLLTRRTMDAFDRSVVGTFAKGVGHAWEHVALHERLQALRRDVGRGHAAALAVMSESADVAVTLRQGDGGDGALMGLAAAMPVSSDARLAALLTRRELDVMQLMAAGETNAGIARALVVAEGTVKSHVKHILRKLRAKNRVEAVSRFAALTSSDARPPSR
jgi:DNA-binding CsgD family transcriptional regulator